MAKQPRQDDAASDADLMSAQGEFVTYLPRDGDPPKTKWAGIVFHANIGQRISDPKLIAKARLNKWFHVGEGAPKVEVEETTEPKNSDQYRAHVATWIKGVTSSAEFYTKWTAEEGLRTACGVGGIDDELLSAFLTPWLAELKKSELPG